MSVESLPPPLPRPRPWVIRVFLLVLVLMAAAAPLAVFYTDWLWYQELGFQQVFLTSLLARAGIVVATGLTVALFLVANFGVALRGLRIPLLMVKGPGQEPTPFVIEEKQLKLVAFGIAVLVGGFIGLGAATHWQSLLMYWHAEPFGSVDPILGKDVSYYVLKLPLLLAGQRLALGVLALAVAGSAGIYALGGGVQLATGGLMATRAARRHLASLVAGLLLVLAAGALLERARLLTTETALIYGAGYADVHARLPALGALFAASLVAAGLALTSAFTPRLRPLATGVVLYAVVALAGSGYAALLQRFVVAPNEQTREAPFIEHNIAATRQAFDLHEIEERQLSGDAELSAADIEANQATLSNVRLWDHGPLLDTFGQIQEIRTYYDFVSVDNDRYTIDGEYRQIMLSARELNSSSLPNRTWMNERLIFTHGYGVTLGPVNEVTEEGLPVLFIKDLPPVSTRDLEVDQPSIYYGELSSDYVLVDTGTKEFHYPQGDDNVFTNYDGRGGVAIDSLARRLLFSVRFGSLKILFSEDLQAGSRVLYHRRIADRVRKIAPFLLLDEDPYLVIEDGRLFWIQDAYTISHRYPYSTPVAGGINYIRNSVKVVIDAFHGSVTFYLARPDDPVAKTLANIFPSLLRPLAEMPEGLRGHIRYPEGIFRAQTQVYATYHMTNPSVFYNKEDQWEIPSTDPVRPQPMEPYYTIMKLPGEEKAEFIQMLPFTPRRKGNLAAWMVARSDGENYGKLMAFEFPKQKVIFGPRQIMARINQDQDISPQITLWNQQGSEVIQGTLLVIPIEESLLYIRPLYLRAQGGRIPELKRVIVATQRGIAMEDTLDEALAVLFGSAPATPRPAPSPGEAAEPAPGGRPGDPVDRLTAQAQRHYEDALAAQRAGDWARYGRGISALGEVLAQLAERQPERQ